MAGTTMSAVTAPRRGSHHPQGSSAMFFTPTSTLDLKNMAPLYDRLYDRVYRGLTDIYDRVID
jgi:hypothetical protein